MTPDNAMILAGAMALIALVAAGAVWGLTRRFREEDEFIRGLDEDRPAAPARPAEPFPLADYRAAAAAHAERAARQLQPGEITQGRVAALHEALERTPGDDDTGSWRIDPVTGALIAPPHTAYLDWPEMTELWRPVLPAPMKP